MRLSFLHHVIPLVLAAAHVLALPSYAPVAARTLAARAPHPSPIVARAPAPSAPSKRHVARGPAPSNAKRSVRDQQPVASALDVSALLCPRPMSICPYEAAAATPASLLAWIEQGFECVDFNEDLTSCGGCGVVDPTFDCTAIPGALGVSCTAGTCAVSTCKTGYTLSADASSCVSVN